MYRIIFTDHFKRQLKHLLKKDSTLKLRLLEALDNFRKDNTISIGRNVFKLRLTGISKGKSGGYRLYLFILEKNGILTPLSIYSKNEKENLPLEELSKHLNQVRLELEDWL